VEFPLDGLSIVMPAHNEEGNVGQAVIAARSAAETYAEKVEVIVVDDGSDDRTADEARRAGADVLVHPRNRGYGAALRTGFDATVMPWIFLLDADNQFDPVQLGDFIPYTGVADLIVGYRPDRADDASRVWAGRVWNRLCQALLGELADDIDCAFKLISGDLVRSLGFRSTGASISAELFFYARRRGARIVELPVRHYPRVTGEQSGLRPRVVSRALIELWQLRRRGLAPVIDDMSAGVT
jgi:glycosyltransferase involved in cell wall biosynthesis